MVINKTNAVDTKIHAVSPVSNFGFSVVGAGSGAMATAVAGSVKTA